MSDAPVLSTAHSGFIHRHLVKRALDDRKNFVSSQLIPDNMSALSKFAALRFEHQCKSLLR